MKFNLIYHLWQFTNFNTSPLERAVISTKSNFEYYLNILTQPEKDAAMFKCAKTTKKEQLIEQNTLPSLLENSLLYTLTFDGR